MRNQGEIPQYYMIGSYEAIIDKETFQKAWKNLQKTKKKENPPIPEIYTKQTQNLRK